MSIVCLCMIVCHICSRSWEGQKRTSACSCGSFSHIPPALLVSPILPLTERQLTSPLASHKTKPKTRSPKSLLPASTEKVGPWCCFQGPEQSPLHSPSPIKVRVSWTYIHSICGISTPGLSVINTSKSIPFPTKHL